MDTRKWLDGEAEAAAAVAVVVAAVLGLLFAGAAVVRDFREFRARVESRGASANAELGQWPVCECCGRLLRDDVECEGMEGDLLQPLSGCNQECKR